MRYAYFRVSTSEKSAKQNYERQEKILEDFQNSTGVIIDRIFVEHVSGSIRADQRTEFRKLLELLKKDDTVYITETSRFGRNYIDCLQMLDILLLEYFVNVHFICNYITLEAGEKMNPYQWLTISNLFLQDEFQRRKIGFDTAKTLQNKKQHGIKLGAPAKYSKEDRNTVIALWANGYTAKKISEKTGMSLALVYNIIKKSD
jgi:DNA invertase Pin-like site-specific DNA recombinase